MTATDRLNQIEARANARVIDTAQHFGTDVPALVAALRAVLDRHRPFTIWDECDCTPEQKDDEHTHTEVDEVGRTCNCLYVVCEECCTGPYGQMEHCADCHDHTLNPVDRCPTVRAIEEALS